MKEKTKSLTEDEQKHKRSTAVKKQSSYGIPPWKMGAAFLSRPLFRVFPLGD